MGVGVLEDWMACTAVQEMLVASGPIYVGIGIF